jgi:hypothetical protein
MSLLDRLFSPEPVDAVPGHTRTADLFLRGLGVIHAIAFASLLPQVAMLIGPHGLLPAGESLALLARGRSLVGAVWDSPTLFWIASSDRVLSGAAALGVALALLVVLRIRTRACLVVLYVLYLSFVTAGRSFFAWQWDTLLLEATVLSLFLPGRAGESPTPASVWLVRFLSFRFYLGAGIAKIVAGDPAWFEGAAMKLFYETVPLPTAIGWWAWHLPRAFHEATTVCVLVCELVVPLLFFFGRRARLLAFFVLGALQIGIALTASFGFFNWLSIVLSLSLLDDGHLRWIPVRPAPRPAAAPEPRRMRVLAALATLFVLAAAVENLVDFALPARAVAAIRPIRRAYVPLHLAHAYHLFGSLERQRIVAEIAGSGDGRTFRRYELAHLPQHPQRAPDFLGPYLPRVSFQAAFLTTRPPGGDREEQRRWLTNLLEAIAHAPRSVRQLFVADPFPTTAPVAIRLGLVRYEVASRREHARSGTYWKRSPLPGADSVWMTDSGTPPRF